MWGRNIGSSEAPTSAILTTATRVFARQRLYISACWAFRDEHAVQSEIATPRARNRSPVLAGWYRLPELSELSHCFREFGVKPQRNPFRACKIHWHSTSGTMLKNTSKARLKSRLRFSGSPAWRAAALTEELTVPI